MKKLMKKLGLLATVTALAVTSVFGLTACNGGNDGGESAKTYLKVGTEALFDPFEYIDPATDTFTGFDIELIDAMSKEMGYDGIEVKDMPFDSIVSAVQTGNVDVAIAAMTINAKRAKSVDFSNPYYDDSAQWLLVPANDTTFTATTKEGLDAQLVGKKIGVAKGQTGYYYAVGGGDFGFPGIKNAKVSEFTDMPAAVLGLTSGTVQCVLADNAVAEEITSKNTAVKAIKVELTVEAYGIATKKGNTDMVKKLNDALAAVKANGTYDTLYNKYFG